GRRYAVPWRVLAAINEVETDYGRNLSVSSAGAVGWMQFMPETWSRWAVDANHDGKLNPYSPLDAIFTAARYLQASGASTDLPAAIYAYNHADWYVTQVLLRTRSLARDLASTGSEKGYSLPLDTQYMAQLGRTDDGVDIEIAPDGALVYSITPGIVSAVASDPAGFGPNYPVVEATRGTLAGQHIYYGHVALALVRPGERVTAGQPLAVMGHTGDAATLGHGHIEIGFSDAVGVPHRGLPAFRQRAPRAGASHWGCLRHYLARRVGNQGAAASLIRRVGVSVCQRFCRRAGLLAEARNLRGWRFRNLRECPTRKSVSLRWQL